MKRIILIRHGDRYDYANKDWRQKIQEAGQYRRDPPLSQLGEEQAKEVGAKVEEMAAVWDNGKVDMIMCSPFLRTIQTAQPLARKLKVPLSLEDGLAEVRFDPSELPTSAQRFAVFPEVDFTANSCYPVEEAENDFLDYFARIIPFSEALNTFIMEKDVNNVVCYSHAASVALVAALLNKPLDDNFKFAPCGIYELQRVNNGPWKLARSGISNEDYVTSNSESTYPWGFNAEDRTKFNEMLKEANK